MDDIQQTRELEQRFGRHVLQLLSVGRVVQRAQATYTPDAYAEYVKKLALTPAAAAKYVALVQAYEAISIERPYAEDE